MILSNRSMCMIPHQSIILPPFSLSLVWLFVEFRAGNEEVAYSGRTCCKVKDWIQQRKQVIQSDQDVHVCGIFVARTRIPLLQISPFYLLLRYELSFIFLSSFFSSHAFWGTDIYIFFFFFFTQPKSFYMMNIKSSVKKGMEHFYGWKAYTCVTSSVEVSI